MDVRNVPASGPQPPAGPELRRSGPPEHAVAKGYYRGPNANAAESAHAAYQARMERNVSTLQASAEVSLSVGNEPLEADA